MGCEEKASRVIMPMTNKNMWAATEWDSKYQMAIFEK
jgi:hypothetical protein